MVHGSLLGAYRHNAFCPFDDDIDVAMPRKDYRVFLEKGSLCMPVDYFIQSCQTEKDCPMTISKLRDTRTTFIQPLYRNLGLNMGMYIDIFPIDYYPENKLKARYLWIKERVLSARISTRLYYEESQPIWRKISRIIATMLYPSWEKAVKIRDELYANLSPSSLVIVVGGKASERGIPASWFSEGAECCFENIPTICPKKTDSYLKCIYGSDYESYNPVQKNMNEDGTLSVVADIVDPKKSYLDYTRE